MESLYYLKFNNNCRYCFSPFGVSLGIKSTKPKRAPNNELLEETFAKNSKWNHKEVVGLAKRLDWTERQVERWLRMRRAQGKPSTLIKFCESRYDPNNILIFY